MKVRSDLHLFSANVAVNATVAVCLTRPGDISAVQRGRIQPPQPYGQYLYNGDPYFAGHAYMSSYISLLLRAEPYTTLSAHYSNPATTSLHPHHHTPPTTPTNTAAATADLLRFDICELAARLLFDCVKWCKGIPFFPELNVRDQVALLQYTWSELFILNVAQSTQPLHMAPLLAGHTAPNVDNRFMSVIEQIHRFQGLVEHLRSIRIDSAEFSCLKAIVLFTRG